MYLPVDSKKLGYGPGTIYASVPFLFAALGLEDGHVPTLWASTEDLKHGFICYLSGCFQEKQGPYFGSSYHKDHYICLGLFWGPCLWNPHLKTLDRKYILRASKSP